MFPAGSERQPMAGDVAVAEAFPIPSLMRHLLHTVCAPDESFLTADADLSATRPDRGRRIWTKCRGRAAAHPKHSPERSVNARGIESASGLLMVRQ